MLVPRVIADAGDQAARRFLEFFAATIRNKNTRQAYYHAVVRFFAGATGTRSARSPISSLCMSPPISRRSAKDFEKPTVKQHLAAIRMLFDWLVTGQVVATNPAASWGLSDGATGAALTVSARCGAGFNLKTAVGSPQIA